MPCHHATVFFNELHRDDIIPILNAIFQKELWMAYKRFTIGSILFLAFFTALYACAQKKVYTVGQPGAHSASLTVPDFIQIRSFDGDSVENIFTRIIYEGKKELVFAAGTHTVKLRYKDIWDIDDDDHEDVTSPYITLHFDAIPGGAYEIRVPAPQDRQGAHELASRFAPHIIDVRSKKRVSLPVEGAQTD
jgi:hypothetical protein